MTVQTSSTLPPVSTLPSLSTAERAAVLDTLFEPCTQLHTLSVSTLGASQFDSYTSLITTVGEQLSALLQSSLASDQVWLEKILCAHPRLGGKDAENLSAMSQAEQSASTGTEDEAVMLRMLNAEYEAVFPGMRYV